MDNEEVKCFDCINWKGWSCEGKCETCISNSNFEKKKKIN